jgi:osmotically inducible lipoprotein OsmB
MNVVAGLSLRVLGSQGQVDDRLKRRREIACFLPRIQAFVHLCHPSNEGRKSMRIAAFALVIAACAGLACCGETPGTRAVTGGLMGAGAGAGVSALTGGKPATGALIGGGVGAVGGAVTR